MVRTILLLEKDYVWVGEFEVKRSVGVNAMGRPKSDFDKAIMRYETICGRIFIRVVMVVLPLLLLDYISPFLWFHRRSKVIREFPVEVVRQPKPYVMFGGVKNGSIYNGEKLNNLGYRGKAPQIPKTSEEFRILMIYIEMIKGDCYLF